MSNLPLAVGNIRLLLEILVVVGVPSLIGAIGVAMGILKD